MMAGRRRPSSDVWLAENARVGCSLVEHPAPDPPNHGGLDLSRFVIAMDGTAGSGKSSASRGVASRLGLRYLDTGAMYRAVTWQMLLDGIDVFDAEAVAARAESLDMESGTDPQHPTIRLHGVSVSREIRSGEVNAAVSPVSAVPRVRELMKARQRELIGSGGIVVEGRDIGTVVAPDADLKVFLTADPSARARRRSAEMEGTTGGLDTVRADLLRRDEYDSTRTTSPLSAAPDAVRLDTTDFTLEQVIDTVVRLASERARVGVHG
jgi:cytidylate kinase